MKKNEWNITLWYIYQNKLDKACFQNDMVYGDFKDLLRRTASDRVLRYKVFDKKLASLIDKWCC